ncbi:MAG: hypothetical protein ACD_61C00265G0004 [uncultured bacterium]|nr:MAG: hypothetical protein ACD_61C00265G0004 [uncultured bacterium]
MVTILIALLVGLTVWMYLTKVFDGLMGFFAFCFIGVVGFWLAGLIGTSYTTEVVVIENLPLHNLYDDSALDGSFFLGTGSIDQREYFFYNMVTPDGMIKPAKIDKYQDNVYVMEDGGDNPRLELVKTIFTDPRSSIWGLVWPDAKWVFHIPAGSVDTNFSVR